MVIIEVLVSLGGRTPLVVRLLLSARIVHSDPAEVCGLEEVIRQYIGHQEAKKVRLEQFNLLWSVNLPLLVAKS